MIDTALLAARGISKSFGAFRALDDVSLNVSQGEIHGLLGANGAGKSTLIGVLCGAYGADSGSVSIGGKMLTTGSLAASRQAGLVVVHQELMLFPERSVEENIFASVLPPAPFAFVLSGDRKRRVESVLQRLSAHIDLNRRVGELPLSQQQLVEIARALCAGGRVLVLDEPTSSLSQTEATGLFSAIRAIVADKAAVVFVSHRLDEVFAHTDAVTVLRDGRVAGHWKTSDIDTPASPAPWSVNSRTKSARARRDRAGLCVAIAFSGTAPGLGSLEISLAAGEVVTALPDWRLRRFGRIAGSWRRDPCVRTSGGRGQAGIIPPSP